MAEELLKGKHPGEVHVAISVDKDADSLRFVMKPREVEKKKAQPAASGA